MTKTTVSIQTMSVLEPQSLTVSPPDLSELSDGSVFPEVLQKENDVDLPRWRAAVIIGAVCLMTLMSTVLSGILAVALPKVAEDIDLEEGLLLWPASVYSLACACTLLLFGSLSDVVGAKSNYIAGSFLSAAWILACGLSRTGIQLIIFRALHGISISMCLPSSVSIMTANFKPGPRRNVAFACLGGAQPVGFLIGLVIGGILTDLVSWRACFYIVAGVNAVVLVVSLFYVPKDRRSPGKMLDRFRTEIDWVGVLVVSTGLALLSYALASATADLVAVRSPLVIAFFVLSGFLLLAFPLWMRGQEKRSRPALIPNSLWSNPIFLSINMLTFLGWATVTANQYFLALFFEKVQLLTAFATSLRFIPLVCSGVLANVATGYLVRRVKANYIIGGTVLVSSGTPLLMALADPAKPYWTFAFPATFLSPIAADAVLIIANLAITSIFPAKTHGLAGGVTNTVAQLGASFGINFTAILATAVTMNSSIENKTSPHALLIGYRASFWMSFGATVAMLVIVIFGLRKIGKVGAIKTD